MIKRAFTYVSLALAGGVVLSSIVVFRRKTKKARFKARRQTNWAGNLIYSTDKVFYPETVQEVQELVKRNEKLRVLGSRHSFNRIADSKEALVSLQEMNAFVSLNKEATTVTVEGGMRYGELALFLQAHGYALPNLASLPHITVVGACSTATHGSGIQNGNLATAVAALEFVNAAGEVVTLSRAQDGDAFNGAVVGLGGLGVVTKITLDLQPTFTMTQVVYLNLPMAALQDHFLQIQAKGYSVSLFTDWQNQNINEVWIKSKVADGETGEIEPELFGATLATQNMHPIASESAVNTTEQKGVPGPWYDRLPHFKLGFKPSAGKELQSECFLPVEHAYAAIMALESMHDKIATHLFISEIRTIKADALWMSPQYQQDTVAFHFTWKQDKEAVMQLLPLIEDKLEPFKPRPHWGKLFTMAPAVLQSRYERLGDFKQLLHAYDPEGKFRNDFLLENLY